MMMRSSTRELAASKIELGLIGAVLVVMAALSPLLKPSYGGLLWTSIIVLPGLAVVWVAWHARRLDTRWSLTIVILAAIGMRLAWLFVDPYGSTDIYRYIWDGRVQAAGINPYRYVPEAPELAGLRDAVIYKDINRASYAPTIYPPVAQMIYLLITRVFGESVVGMKLGLMAFEGLTVVCLLTLLRVLDKPRIGVAAYLWHPLPVFEIAGNGHVDAAMAGLVMAGLTVAVVTNKSYVAGVLLTAAALVKPTALLALPALWRPWGWRLPALVAGVIGLCYLPYLSVGSRVFGFLPSYFREESLASNAGLRYLSLLEHVTGPIAAGGPLYIAASGTILLIVAFLVAFRQTRTAQSLIEASALLLTVFLVLLTPHYPWYYLVLVPFLALTHWCTPWVLTLGAFLIDDFIPGEAWPPFNTRDDAFRLMALAALAADFYLWRVQLRALASALSPRRVHGETTS